MANSNEPPNIRVRYDNKSKQAKFFGFAYLIEKYNTKTKKYELIYRTNTLANIFNFIITYYPKEIETKRNETPKRLNA